MTQKPRETFVLDAVVTLVDSLLGDFDIVELLTDLAEQCAQLLDVDAAGLLLAGPTRHLRLMAATSEESRDLELFQLQADEGRAWIATLPVNRSRSLTFTRSSRAGRSSWPPPPKPGSPPYMWCRCAPPALS